MIQDDSIILNAFSREFNARFNTLEFLNNSDKLTDILNEKGPDELRHLIHLRCPDVETFNQLITFRYADLLSDIIRRVRIEDEAIDNYLSEMTAEMVQIYSGVLLAMAQVTTVKLNAHNLSFDVICPELFVELLWSPISQFHNEAIIQLTHLSPMVDLSVSYMQLTSDKPAVPNLFLNSKVATAYSYFILAFIAENLNIPLKL